jgi:hypothetical protein
MSLTLQVSFGLLLMLLSGLNDAQPILGYLDTKLLSIQKVDGVEQSFVADFYLTLYFQPPGWTKTQLPDGEVIDPAVVDASNFPVIEFENANDYQPKYVTHYFLASKPSTEMRNFLYTRDDKTLPWVKQDSRYTGTFRTVLPLRNFPFDVQQINLNIETSNLDDTTFRFVVSPNSSFASKLGNTMQEWDVVASITTATDIYYDTWSQYYSRGRFGLELRRLSGYYVTKIVVGLAFLVLLEMATFAIEPSGSDRITGSITVFLAMVAYLFVVSSDVPKISYNTRLDDYIFLCMVIVTIATIYHAAISVACRLTIQMRESASDSEPPPVVVSTSPADDEDPSTKRLGPRTLSNNYLICREAIAVSPTDYELTKPQEATLHRNGNGRSFELDRQETHHSTVTIPTSATPSSSLAKEEKRSSLELTVHEKMVKYSLHCDLAALILLLGVFLISSSAILGRRE